MVHAARLLASMKSQALLAALLEQLVKQMQLVMVKAFAPQLIYLYPTLQSVDLQLDHVMWLTSVMELIQNVLLSMRRNPMALCAPQQLEMEFV